MRQRYFLIEPKYSDPDTFCSFIIGSDRVRASIQIYANLWMLEEVARALVAPTLEFEHPQHENLGEWAFDLQLSVLPGTEGNRIIRFNVMQDGLDDGATFRADIRFDMTNNDAAEFARDLRAWCQNPVYAFAWKGD
jgi:hypothetical protein